MNELVKRTLSPFTPRSVVGKYGQLAIELSFLITAVAVVFVIKPIAVDLDPTVFYAIAAAWATATTCIIFRTIAKINKSRRHGHE